MWSGAGTNILQKTSVGVDAFQQQPQQQERCSCVQTLYGEHNHADSQSLGALMLGIAH